MKGILLIIMSLPLIAEVDLKLIKSRYSSLLTKEYVLLPHNGTYILPVSYNTSPNNKPFEQLTATNNKSRGKFNRHLEAEFQFSALMLGVRQVFSSDVDLFIAYTQRSRWQIYNDQWSRPFRETNYSPEVFFRINYFDFDKTLLGGIIPIVDIGYIHQSNGQLQELSRSWDRFFVRTVIDYGHFIFLPSLWMRIPEKKEEDDNPNIEKYLGYGELKFIKTFKDLKQLSLRIIPGTHKAGFEIEYSRPWKGRYRFYSKISSGVGLSLLDYKHEGHKIGVGIILSDLITSKK